MHHAEKYSIAWFKLAECVARKEKERAFGVYRLLSHSLDDDALAEQLAGDLFLAFDDQLNAIEKYKVAAQKYLAHHKYLESAAVYEHLATLEPTVDTYRIQLIERYRHLGQVAKVNEQVKALFSLLMNDHKLDKASYVAEQLESSVQPSTIAIMQEQLLYAFFKQNRSHELALTRIKKILGCWRQLVANEQIERVMKAIKELDEGLYEQAVVLCSGQNTP